MTFAPRTVWVLDPLDPWGAQAHIQNFPMIRSLPRSSDVTDFPDLAAIEAAGGFNFDDVGVVVFSDTAHIRGSGRWGNSRPTPDDRFVDAIEVEPQLFPLCKPYPSSGYDYDSTATWGIHGTQAICSPYLGASTSVAVLDTGCADHPDLSHVEHVSFVFGETSRDSNGHGTHCLGTVGGRRTDGGYRYSVAPDTHLISGKVVNVQGWARGLDALLGIWWAIAKRNVTVVSMSLGVAKEPPSAAFNAFGKFALSRGSLIVAAAGNSPGPVWLPANSRHIMAVGAISKSRGTPSFAPSASRYMGSEVDIAGPGVDVWSAKLSGGYVSSTGTSMATPHVAGVAALWAEATGARGQVLWDKVTRCVLPMSDTARLGTGLTLAPGQGPHPNLSGFLPYSQLDSQRSRLRPSTPPAAVPGA